MSNKSAITPNHNFQIDFIEENLIPICAWCQRIRDRQHNWHVIDDIEPLYRSGYQVTHVLCLDCAKSEMDDYLLQ